MFLVFFTQFEAHRHQKARNFQKLETEKLRKKIKKNKFSGFLVFWFSNCFFEFLACWCPYAPNCVKKTTSFQFFTQFGTHTHQKARNLEKQETKVFWFSGFLFFWFSVFFACSFVLCASFLFVLLVDFLFPFTIFLGFQGCRTTNQTTVFRDCRQKCIQHSCQHR